MLKVYSMARTATTRAITSQPPQIPEARCERLELIMKHICIYGNPSMETDSSEPGLERDGSERGSGQRPGAPGHCTRTAVGPHRLGSLARARRDRLRGDAADVGRKVGTALRRHGLADGRVGNGAVDLDRGVVDAVVSLLYPTHLSRAQECAATPRARRSSLTLPRSPCRARQSRTPAGDAKRRRRYRQAAR